MGVEIRGLAKHLSDQDLRVAALSDLTPLMDRMGRMALSSVKDNFIKSRTPEGKRWPDVAPKTKARLVGGRFAQPVPGRVTIQVGQILLRTNRLFNSIKYRPHKKSFRVFTTLHYAATHQFGDRSRNIPRRKYLGLKRKDRVRFERMLENYLTREFRGFGRSI